MSEDRQIVIMTHTKGLAPVIFYHNDSEVNRVKVAFAIHATRVGTEISQELQTVLVYFV